MSQNMHDLIAELIKNNKIVLFMKGTADFPQCGFSANVVNILNKLNVSFKDVNILENMELRQAIKDYSDWPTIPQLYIDGEFIGGSDIATELFNSGELQHILSGSGK